MCCPKKKKKKKKKKSEMLDTVVSSLLSRFLGDYLHGLDAHHLNLSLLSGKVELRDVQVKGEALAALQMPWRVVFGRVALLQLNMPWYKIGSAPVEVRIEGVDLLVEPTSDYANEEDVDFAKRCQQALARQKMRRLASAEAISESVDVKSSNSDDAAAASTSFAERLAMKIVSNLQVTIERVHVRYQTGATVRSSDAFGAGLLLRSLRVESTDEQWQPHFNREYRPMMYKVLAVDGLCAYWTFCSDDDDDAKPIVVDSSADQILASMNAVVEGIGNGDRYVLVPLDGGVRLAVSLRPPGANQWRVPKIALDVSLADVALKLSERQWASVLRIADLLRAHSLRKRYQHLRPPPGKFNARRLWRYAVDALLVERRERARRFTVGYLRKRAEQRSVYVRLYAQRKFEVKRRPLTGAQKKQLERLEEALDFDAVILFRSIAIAQARHIYESALASRRQPLLPPTPPFLASPSGPNLAGKNRSRLAQPQQAPAAPPPATAAAAAQGAGWRSTVSSWLFGAAESPSSSMSPPRTPSSSSSSSSAASSSPLPDSLEGYEAYFGSAMAKELSALVDADNDSDDASVRASNTQASDDQLARYAEVCVDVRVGSVSVQLCAGDRSPLLSGKLRALATSVQLRSSSLSVRSSLRAIKVVDHCSRPSAPFRMLSQSRLAAAAGAASSPALLKVAFDQSPLDSDADFRVAVKLRPVDAILSRVLVERIVHFFVATPSDSLDDLKQAAFASVDAWKNLARAQLASQLSEPKRLDLDIELAAPNVVVPHRFESGESSVAGLLARLGTFRLRTDSESGESGDDEAMFYDRFEMSASQIMVAVATLDVHAFAVMQTTDELVENVDIDVALLVSRVPAVELAKVKLIGTLPRIAVNLAPRTFEGVLLAIKQLLDEGDQSSVASSSSAMATASALTANAATTATTATTIAASTPTTNAETTLIAIEFQIGDVSLQLCADDGERLLKASVRRLALDFVERSRDRHLSASLGTLHLINCAEEAADRPAHVRYLIASEGQSRRRNSHALSVSVDSSALPDAAMVHRVECTLESMAINVAQPIIVRMIDYGLRCGDIAAHQFGSGNSESDDAPAADAAPGQGEQAIRRSGDDDHDDDGDAEVRAADQIRLRVKVHSVSVLLNGADAQKFVELSVASCGVKLKTRADRSMALHCAVGGLDGVWHALLADEALASRANADQVKRWARVLRAKGQLLDLRFATTTDRRRMLVVANDGGVVRQDATLDVKVGSVRVIATTRLATALLDYFGAFGEQVSAALTTTAQQAKEAAERASRERQLDGKFTHIEVDVLNAFVIAPRDLSEPNTSYLVADLGHLTLASKLDAANTQRRGGVAVQTLSLGVSALNVNSYIPASDAGSSAPPPDALSILADASVSLSVVHSLTANLTPTQIQLTLSELCVTLSETQIDLLINVAINGLRRLSSGGEQQKALSSSSNNNDDNDNDDNDDDVHSNFALELAIQMQGVSLALSAGDGADSDAAMLRAELNNIVAALDMSAGDMSAQAAIGSIVVRDARVLDDNFTHHRRILAPAPAVSLASAASPSSGGAAIQRHPLPEHQQLRIALTRSGDDTTLKVDFYQPQIVLPPDCICHSLLGFLLPLADRSVASLQLGDQQQQQQQQRGDDNGVTRPQAKSTLKIEARVHRATIVLVEGHVRRNLPAMLLSTDLVASVEQADGATNVDANVAELCVLKCRLDEQMSVCHATPVLSPINLHAGVTMAPPRSTKVDVDVSQLAMWISYEDIKLSLHLLAAWSDRAERYRQKDVVDASPATLDDDNDRVAAAAAAVADDQQQQLALGLRVEAIQIYVINDCYRSKLRGSSALALNTPVVRLLVGAIDAEVLQRPPTLGGSFRCNDIRVDYFNNLMEHWEPVVEPWQFTAGLGTLRKPDTGMALQLVAPSVLNVNVTQGFLHTTLGCVDVWSEDYAESLRAIDSAQDRAAEDEAALRLEEERAKFHPFYFANNTGLLVSYWLMDDAEQRYDVDDGDMMPIVGLESAVVDPTTTKPTNANGGNAQRRQQQQQQSVGFAVHVPSGDGLHIALPVTNVRMSEITSFIVPLEVAEQPEQRRQRNATSSTSKLPHRLFLSCDIRLMHGSKVLRVSSRVVVKNHLAVPVLVDMRMPAPAASNQRRLGGRRRRSSPRDGNGNDDDSCRLRVKLAPGARCHVPLLLAERGELSVRPLVDGSAQYAPSTRPLSLHRVMAKRAEWAKAQRKREDHTDQSAYEAAAAVAAAATAEGGHDDGTAPHPHSLPTRAFVCPPIADATLANDNDDDSDSDGDGDNSASGAPPYIVCASIQQERRLGGQKTSLSMRSLLRQQSVVLYAPLIVENALICKMQFRVAAMHRGDIESIVFGPATLRRGQKICVPTLSPSGVHALQMRIKGYQWCAPALIGGAMKARLAESLTIHDNLKRPLQLSVSNVEALANGGVRRVTIYCVTWLINRSGASLHYKRPGGLLSSEEEAAGQRAWQSSHAAAASTSARSTNRDDWYTDCKRKRRLQSKPFMFSGDSLSVQLPKSAWSQPLGLANMRSAVQCWSVLTIPVADDGAARRGGLQASQQAFALSVSSRPGPGKFWRTQLLTFEAHVTLVNNLGMPVIYAQYGVSQLERLEIGELLPFHWADASVPESRRLLRIRVDGCEWSAGFSIGSLRRFQLKLSRFDRATADQDIVARVNVVVEDSTVTVQLSRDDSEFPDYLIDNQTDVPLFFRQHMPTSSSADAGTSSSASRLSTPSISEASISVRAANVSERWQVLEPAKATPFVWDEPEMALQRLDLRIGESGVDAALRRPLSLDRLRRYPPYFPSAGGFYMNRGGGGGGRRRRHQEANESSFDVVSAAASGLLDSSMSLIGLSNVDDEGFEEDDDDDVDNDSGVNGRSANGVASLETERQVSSAAVASSPSSNKDAGALSGVLSRGESLRQLGAGYVLDVKARGPTKVLLVRRLRDVVKELERDAQPATSTSAAAAASSADNDDDAGLDPKHVDVTCNFAGIGVSLIDSRPRELAYVSVLGVQAHFMQTEQRQTVELKLAALQIDNQMPATPYPILLYPVCPEGRDFFHCSLVKSVRHSSINLFHYAAVGLQEFDIQVDEVFLLELLVYINFVVEYFRRRQDQAQERQLLASDSALGGRATSMVIRRADDDDVFSEDDDDDDREFDDSADHSHGHGRGDGNDDDDDDSDDGERRLEAAAESNADVPMYYFELLQLNPIKATVSFMTVPGGRTDTNQRGTAFDFLLDVGGVLANVDQAPLRMNGIAWENPFLRQDDLVRCLTQHFTQQWLGALGTILGSTDALGNPVALFKGIGTGFKDFFVEPAQGIVSSPADFGLGIAKGTTSLLKNSVFSLSNTASKLTGTVGKAITAVTFDADWKRKRERAQRQRARHIGHGLALGVRDLGSGFMAGLTGIVAEPIKGASRDGVLGFAAGVGRGVTGVFLKPTIGAVDLVTRTTEGVRNTTTYFDDDTQARIRPPRHIGTDRLVKAYDADAAAGQAAVVSLAHGRFADDCFMWLAPLHGDVAAAEQSEAAPSSSSIRRTWFLLSDETFFYLHGSPAPGQRLQIKWRVPLLSVGAVMESGDNVQVLLKDSAPYNAPSTPEAHRHQLVTMLAELLSERQHVRQPFDAHDPLLIGSNSEREFVQRFDLGFSLAPPAAATVAHASPPTSSASANASVNREEQVRRHSRRHGEASGQRRGREEEEQQRQRDRRQESRQLQAPTAAVVRDDDEATPLIRNRQQGKESSCCDCCSIM
jgi:Vacuolar-sorting-associated 13 protein, DH-like domain/Vacuolar sorting-associated protein 13, extended-chorein/Vacuolar-sorting associated protein 13, adaptor binding domain/VPS13, central RBG modules/VPS13-like, N-terminal/ATG2/VPS13, C terminal domain/Intermembrane lipid transfer protein VPS13, C-terminal